MNKSKQYRLVFTNEDGTDKHEGWVDYFPSELIERVEAATHSGFPTFRIEFRDEQ
jgi:hypothetical protein